MNAVKYGVRGKDSDGWYQAQSLHFNTREEAKEWCNNHRREGVKYLIESLDTTPIFYPRTEQ